MVIQKQLSKCPTVRLRALKRLFGLQSRNKNRQIKGEQKDNPMFGKVVSNQVFATAKQNEQHR
jgi:hypothetical protein